MINIRTPNPVRNRHVKYTNIYYKQQRRAREPLWGANFNRKKNIRRALKNQAALAICQK